MSLTRSAGRILTTHAGSLPRPEKLLALIVAKEEGTAVDDAQLASELSTAVDEIMRKQIDAGVDVVNDGEMSKITYATYVKDRLTGFGRHEESLAVLRAVDLHEFPDYARQLAATAPPIGAMDFRSCDGPISYRDLSAVEGDIERLKASTARMEPKSLFMSAASPGVISVFFENHYYPTEEEYLEAIANAMRTEYEAIHRAGIVLQLDCPDLAALATAEESLDAFRKKMELRVEALNLAVDAIPADAMRMHVCWGNLEVPRHNDVPLKDIIDIILKAKPAGIMLMAANGRHEHEWKVFEDVVLDDGKYVIPGVLDSTTNIIEHPEVVAQRLVRYANVVGKDRVMAGTDCGFATGATFQLVAPTIVWAKLQAMRDGAAIASRELW